MDKKSYNLFYERYKKNPFIKICFRYLIPYLFKVDKEEVVEKNEIKSGLQALIERNKKRSEKLEKENNSGVIRKRLTMRVLRIRFSNRMMSLL